MGFHLVEEVLTHAPADMTPSERLLLITLAHTCNDVTRMGWPGMAYLASRTHSDQKTIQRAIQRWEMAPEDGGYGWMVRAPIGCDKNGKLYFAAKGHHAVYAIPRLAPATETKGGVTHPTFGPENLDIPKVDTKGGADRPTFGSDISPTRLPETLRGGDSHPLSIHAISPDPLRGGDSPTLSEAKGGADHPQRWGDSPPPSVKEHKISLSHSETVTSLWSFLDVSDERERDDIKTHIADILAERGIRSVEAVIPTMLANGTIWPVVNDARTLHDRKCVPRYRKIHPWNPSPDKSDVYCLSCGFERGHASHWTDPQAAEASRNTPPPSSYPTGVTTPPAGQLGAPNGRRQPLATLRKL